MPSADIPDIRVLRRISFAAVAAALLAGCAPSDSTAPADGSDPSIPPGASMSASLVVADVSQPAGLSLSGTVEFSGLTVELWDGEEWYTLADAPTSATVELGEGAAEATLVPATEIPVGEYTQVRFTASEAEVNVSVQVNDHSFSAQIQPPTDQPIVVEKDVEVIVNDDGSRTLRIKLRTFRSAAVSGGSLVFDGDLWSGAASMAMSASLVASDASTIAGAEVSGTVTFDGLAIELWDGEQWLTVSDEPTTASVALGDGAAEATLMPASEIPAGDYEKVRLTATAAVIDLTVVMDGKEYSAQIPSPAGESVVIEKELEVIVNEDGSRAFRVELVCLRSLDVAVDPDSGEILVTVSGDLGTAQATASP